MLTSCFWIGLLLLGTAYPEEKLTSAIPMQTFRMVSPYHLRESYKPWWTWLPEDWLAQQMHYPKTQQPAQWRRFLSDANVDIPVYDHPLVDAYIAYFTGRGRGVFLRWLQETQRYREMVQPILAKYQLPQDLIYLAMIESGFNPHARSKAKAVGVWQFMAPTGKLLGLRSSAWIDDRRDVSLATQAAARYLRGLYRETGGDWHLTWASYNAGPGRIQRALHAHKVKKFWDLIEVPGSLNVETRHYVPKMIAAALVAHNAERLGLVPAQSKTQGRKWYPSHFTYVQVPPNTHLLTVAKALGGNLKELTELNPSLLQLKTPPSQTINLRVPSQLWTLKTQKALLLATQHQSKKYIATAKMPVYKKAKKPSSAAKLLQSSAIKKKPPTARR